MDTDIQQAMVGMSAIITNDGHTKFKFIKENDKIAFWNYKDNIITVSAYNSKNENALNIFRYMVNHECMHVRYDRDLDYEKFLREKDYPKDEDEIRIFFINLALDIKNDTLGANEFPGIRNHLKFGNEWLVNLWKERIKKVEKRDSMEEALISLKLLPFGYAVDDLWEVTDKTKEIIQFLKENNAFHLAQCKTTEESEEEAMRLYELLKEKKKEEMKNMEEKEGEGKEGEGKEGEGKEGEEKGKPKRGRGRPKGSKNKNKSAESEKKEGEEKEGEEKEREGEKKVKEFFKDMISRTKDILEEYCKENYHEGESDEDYNPMNLFDRIEKEEVSNENYEDERNRIGVKMNTFKGVLVRGLISLKRTRKIEALEDGELDTDNAAEIALKTIDKSENRFYFKNTNKKELNTCVSLLIDQSGSMSGKKIHEAQNLTMLLAEALHTVRIPFEAVGFTTNNYKENCFIDESGFYNRTTPLMIKIFKTFDENYGAIKRRFLNIRKGYMNENVDGESLELVLKRIIPRKENRKVVFVLSDGMPANVETNPLILNKHLKDVINKGRRSGVEIFAFGILCDYPERFYGKDNTMVIYNLEDLGSQFFNKMVEILLKKGN